MPNSRHERLADIFEQALLHTGDARRSFLSETCQGDEDLRREVDSLLCAHAARGGFMQTSFVPSQTNGNSVSRVAGSPRDSKVNSPDDSAMAEPAPGDRIGRYEILEPIASGGMGTVFRAQRADGECHQVVAIKLVRPEHRTRVLRARLIQERQLLASLEHPHITRLIDAGTTAPPPGAAHSSDSCMPYFVMEFVDGIPIDQHCDRNRFTIRQRLEIMVTVCGAVRYAHRKLIVHRDLKPGNILVDVDGHPKLLDFGISKLIDDSGSSRKPSDDGTTTINRALTPRYACPEHWRGEPATTGADVYSLGVILYELLTGARPFDYEPVADFFPMRSFPESTPRLPSQAVRARRNSDAESGQDPARRCSAKQLERQLSGDLDNIVRKAMHFDPDMRYASVEQLSDDIERYLSGRPVVARRDTFCYRATKFVKRNRFAAAVTGVAVLALVVGAVVTVHAMIDAKRSAALARSERAEAMLAREDSEEVLQFLRRTLSRANPYRQARDITMIEWLHEAADKVDVELSGRPAVEAGVRLVLAQSYADLWQWPAASHELAIAARLFEEVGNDEKRADCLNLWGRALTFSKDIRAASIQRKGLQMRRRLYGTEHRKVAESLGNLGYALWHGATDPDWADAERHYRDALAMYKRLGFEDDKDVARFTFSLAVMLRSSGQFNESERMFRRAIDIYERLPQTEDRYASECMIKYAGLLIETDRHVEASSVIRKAEPLLPDSVGGAGLYSALWMLGRGYASCGQFKDAERVYRKSLANRCHALARTDSRYEDTLSRVADGLQSSHAPMRLADAISALLPMLDTPERIIGSVRDVLRLLLDSDRREEADSLRRTWEGRCGPLAVR